MKKRTGTERDGYCDPFVKISASGAALALFQNVAAAYSDARLGGNQRLKVFRFITLAVAALLLLQTTPKAIAQPDAPLALDYAAAQKRLLETSNAIEAADANVLSKGAQERSTRTLRRPEIEFETQLLEYQKTLYLPLGPLTPVGNQFGLSTPLEFKQDKSSIRPIVTATVPFYTGGQIGATQEGARSQVKVAEAERAKTTDESLQQLIRAYYGQQLSERALGVRREVLEGLERHVTEVTRLKEEGFASRAQRLQAEVARDEANIEYHKAIAALAGANVALSGLLRSPQGVRPLSPLFVLTQALEPLDDFRSAALGHNPKLKELKATGDLAAAGVQIEQAKRRPQVYGFSQYNFDPRDALLTDPDWMIGVGIRYKFLSSVDLGQSVAAARLQEDRARAGAREMITQLDIGVTRAWFDVSAAQKNFLLLDGSVLAAQENLRLQNIAYREQQATSLDVVDAQLGVGRARIQQAQAAYDYVLALADILSLSGQIERFPEYQDRADRIVP